MLAGIVCEFIVEETNIEKIIFMFIELIVITVFICCATATIHLMIKYFDTHRYDKLITLFIISVVSAGVCGLLVEYIIFFISLYVFYKLLIYIMH